MYGEGGRGGGILPVRPVPDYGRWARLLAGGRFLIFREVKVISEDLVIGRHPQESSLLAFGKNNGA